MRKIRKICALVNENLIILQICCDHVNNDLLCFVSSHRPKSIEFWRTRNILGFLQTKKNRLRFNSSNTFLKFYVLFAYLKVKKATICRTIARFSFSTWTAAVSLGVQCLHEMKLILSLVNIYHVYILLNEIRRLCFRAKCMYCILDKHWSFNSFAEKASNCSPKYDNSSYLLIEKFTLDKARRQGLKKALQWSAARNKWKHS